VVLIALVALLIASDRDSRVLDLVSYAWAGFGAAFGPLVVFSLCWRKMTALSAVVGMLLGAITVVVWSNLSGGIFDLYEIVPGFLLSSLAIVGISLLRPEAKLRTLAQFDAAARLTAKS
jgi:sodium/proline symporter